MLFPKLRYVVSAFLIVLAFSVNAQSELTEAEDARAIDWLQLKDFENNQASLMESLVGYHYFPEKPQKLMLDAELDKSELRIRLSVLIDQCTKFPDIDYCEGMVLEDRLKNIDPDNLTPYLYAFSNFVRERDFDKALDVLMAGLTSTQTNDYYFEKVMYLRDALSTLGFTENRANLAAELFSQNSFLSVYTATNPTCVAQSQKNELWKSTCLDLSSRLEKGLSFFSRVYGAAIRRDVVSATTSNEEEISDALAQRAFYDDFRIRARAHLGWWDTLEQRPDSFYIDASLYGEFEAIERAIERSIAESEQ